LNEDRIKQLSQLVLTGKSIEAIYVREEGLTPDGRIIYGCFDGIHRLETMKRLKKTSIEARIFNISDEETIKMSHTTGCGLQWSEAEKADVCLRLYELGTSIGSIMQMNPVWTENIIKRYIKIAKWLDPELADKIGRPKSKMGITLAELLAEVPTDKQKEIFKTLSTEKGNKLELLKRYFIEGKCQRVKRDIRSLIGTKQEPKVKAVDLITFEPITVNKADIVYSELKTLTRSEFEKIINDVVTKYCVDHHIAVNDMLRSLAQPTRQTLPILTGYRHAS
jgi:ParB-like chromosome segregation protein Spo0J